MNRAFLFGLMILSQIPAYSVFAGGGTSDVGNGGLAVVCRSGGRWGAIRSATLLDLAEAEHAPLSLAVGRTDAAYETQVEAAVAKLPEPGMRDRFREMRSLMLAHTSFNQRLDLDLTETRDTHSIYHPRGRGCRIEQAANYTDDGELIISQEIWDGFDTETDRAAVHLHEPLYKIARDDAGQTDSDDTRKLVGYLLASGEYASEIREYAFKVFGWPYMVGTHELRIPDSALSQVSVVWSSSHGACAMEPGLHMYESSHAPYRARMAGDGRYHASYAPEGALSSVRARERLMSLAAHCALDSSGDSSVRHSSDAEMSATVRFYYRGHEITGAARTCRAALPVLEHGAYGAEAGWLPAQGMYLQRYFYLDPPQDAAERRSVDESGECTLSIRRP